MPWMVTPQDMQRYWADFQGKMAAIPDILETARKARVGTTPNETVYRHDKLQLLRYTTDVEQQFETPLLFVFALINRPYILDLRDGKSVVRHFVNAGHDTYNLDWGVPTAGDKGLGMHDYIERYLDSVVDHIRKTTGQDKINILGYCMGGSMSAIYTAMHPEKVKNLIMLAAPVDWSNRDHLLAKWTAPDVFDVDRLIDAHGNAPADMLQHSFQLLKPVSNMIEKYVSFYENMENEKFLEDFFAMETWLNDKIQIGRASCRERV